jgi:hypothetical protein
LSEASIGFFVDGNHVWGIPSPVRRGYDAAFDPVMDDPEAHAIFFTNLTNIQGPWRRLGRWYAMFVAQPFDSAERDRLAGGRALLAVFSQQGDDFIVMMVHRQLSKASDECLGIADDVGPVLRHLDLQGLGFAALPADLQSDEFWLWPLLDGDVAHEQTQNALAIARLGGRRRP